MHMSGKGDLTRFMNFEVDKYLIKMIKLVYGRLCLGFGCACDEHSVPHSFNSCKPCNATQVLSADGTSCVPRKCQNTSGRFVCRKCPIDYISGKHFYVTSITSIIKYLILFTEKKHAHQTSYNLKTVDII